MASAYTPGLKIVSKTLVEKDRKLPLLGEVKVAKGDVVKAETVVAATHLPGNVYMVNIANLLSIEPNELPVFLKKKEGDLIDKDDIIAETNGFFGFFKSYVRSPIKGSIENISSATGQAVLREPPIPVEVHAYIDGVVDEIYDKEGVSIKTNATFIQGIFGIGGEITGALEVVSKSPEDILEADDIKPSHAGKIIVGGSLVTAKALEQAIHVGVRGVIVGGYDAQDLKEFLGFDLGVAITGTEEKGITLVVTEGFGKIQMAKKTYDLLKASEGRKTSINGATQIRAGVIRPEVIIPLEQDFSEETVAKSGMGMTIGTNVRIIRQPHFGEVAKVVGLPEKPVVIESEARVRVVDIETTAGLKLTLPRANVEIIEE
jgi:hypothetical protein